MGAPSCLLNDQLYEQIGQRQPGSNYMGFSGFEFAVNCLPDGFALTVREQDNVDLFLDLLFTTFI